MGNVGGRRLGGSTHHCHAASVMHQWMGPRNQNPTTAPQRLPSAPVRHSTKQPQSMMAPTTPSTTSPGCAAIVGAEVTGGRCAFIQGMHGPTVTGGQLVHNQVKPAATPHLQLLGQLVQQHRLLAHNQPLLGHNDLRAARHATAGM